MLPGRGDTSGVRQRARLLQRIGEQQQALHADSATLTAWGERYPEVFAGIWFDNAGVEAGRGPVTLCLGVLRSCDDALLEPVRARLRHPHLLRVVRHEHTLAALGELQARITQRYMGHRQHPRDTYVSTVVSDVVNNAVDVGLSEVDDAFARQLLEAFPGQPLTVTQGVRVVPLRGPRRPPPPSAG